MLLEYVVTIIGVVHSPTTTSGAWVKLALQWVGILIVVLRSAVPQAGSECSLLERSAGWSHFVGGLIQLRLQGRLVVDMRQHSTNSGRSLVEMLRCRY